MDVKKEMGKQESFLETSPAKIKVYHMSNPGWRSRLHPGSEVIGVPDMQFHTENVAEDDISESNVKNGFSVPQVVGNETFSAHDMIFDRLKAKDLLSQMGTLFHEVSLRKHDLLNHRGSASYLQSRPPQRVTLNEVKLAAYIKQLADASVSLKKLARSVPHGYRGERMLDMLWNGGNLTPAMAAIKAQSTSTAGSSTVSRSVTIERATWFVRVVGASELTSSRARQSNGNSYTIEWTNVVMSWIRKQILELNIIQSSVATPTTPASPAAAVVAAAAASASTNGRPAGYRMSISSSSFQDSHYSLLLDDDFRNRWVAKWQYSILLLRELCFEHLVDPQVVTKSVLDMLRTANIAQLSFVLALCQEFVEVIFSSFVLLNQTLDILCGKLNDSTLNLDEGRFGTNICKEIQSMIFTIATRMPETFVNPSRWMKHKELLLSLMNECLSEKAVTIVVHRNERLLRALLDKEVPEMHQSEADKQRRDIAILDRIAIDLSIEDAFVELFQPSKQNSSEKLRTMLIWSTTTWRSGHHRPFAGAQLLYLFSQTKKTNFSRHGKIPPSVQKVDLGTFLLKWISEVESSMQQREEGNNTSRRSSLAATQSIDVSCLITLIGETVRLGIFSYPKYLQRLTARGLTATQSRDDKNGSMNEYLHAKLMRSVPLSTIPASLEHQRRVAIYGNRNKESWEEAMQRRAFKEAINIFPWSSLPSSSAQQDLIWNVEEPMRHFWSSSRFVQNRVIQGHFMAYFQQRRSFYNLTPRCLAHLAQFLIRANDFVALCEIILILCDNRANVKSPTMLTCVDITLEHRIVWISMDVPLLQKFGFSAFPAQEVDVKVERRLSRGQHMDGGVQSKMQESARHFLCGDMTQASTLLAEAVQQSHNDSIACTLLDASTIVLREIGRERRNIVLLTNWMRLVPEAASTTWDMAWQHSIVDSLASHSFEEAEDSTRGLSALVLRLVQDELISTLDILQQFILPRLEQAEAFMGGAQTALLQITLDLVCGLFLDEVELAEAEDLARLRSIRATLIVPSRMKEITMMLSHLTILGQNLSSDAITLIKQRICRQPLIQIYFQANLFEMCTWLEEKLRGDQLDHTVAILLPTQQTLLQANALELDYPQILSDSNDWLCQQRLFEMSILLHRLDSVESGQQNRGQNKIQMIALHCAHLWFTPSTIQRYGLPLLDESRSTTFATSIMEEMFKRIKKLLLEVEKDDTKQNHLKEAIQCAMQIFESRTNLTLPSSSVAASLLLLISEWFNAGQDHWGDESKGEEELGLRLAILCLLLRFQNLWTVHSRTCIPDVVFALLQTAIALSSQGEVRNAVIYQILDVAAYCLHEVTSEVRQFFYTTASDSIVEMIQYGMPEAQIANQIYFLLNRMSVDHVLTGGSTMVLATNATSAFITKRFIPVMERPWELHNNVEALEYYLHKSKDGGGGGREQQDGNQDQNRLEENHIDSTFNPMPNNGPISLELFAAKQTRDRLPPEDVKVNSEVSYGLGWGGEPLYARDVRRALLNFEADDEVKRRGASLMRVKGLDDSSTATGGAADAASSEKATQDSTKRPASLEESTSITSKKRSELPSSAATNQKAAARKKAKKR